MNDQVVFQPKLESTRLILRKISFNDTEFIFKHFSDPDVCKYLVDEEPLTDMEGAREIIQWASTPENRTHNRWGIQLKENNELIGTCGFHNWDKHNNKAEIGYDLAKKYWRKGLCSEALGIMIKSGFERMRLNRIEAFVHIENIASYRLLKKLGFHVEGIVRDKHLFRGQYYDHFYFSLLASDLKS